MANTEKELWKAIVEWFELVKRDNERIAAIRQELAKLGALEETKISSLDVSLY